jgi:aspartate aminotransferase-like enzyme
MMESEGLENIFARHIRHCKATRAAAKAMGLSLFADDSCSSASITAIATPDAEKIRSTIKKHFDIVMAGGQDHLNGSVFRIGHLGFVSDRDILTAVSALEGTLKILGHDGFTSGAGVGAAIAALNSK